jgi:hypothetical protein
MLSKIYEALIATGAPEDKARRRAPLKLHLGNKRQT